MSIIPGVLETARIPRFLQVVAYVRRGIEEGVFAPGEALPSEHEIARRLGFHRLTVNKALNLLVQDGVLERVRGVGTFVRKVSKSPLTCSLVYYLNRASLFESPYFFGIFRGIEAELTAAAARILFTSIRPAPGIDVPPPAELDVPGTDGHILLGVQSDEYVARFCREGRPVVVVDYLGREPGAVYVKYATAAATAALTRRLAATGCRSLGFVGHMRLGLNQTPVPDQGSMERCDAHVGALEELGLEPPAEPARFLPPGRREASGIKEWVERNGLDGLVAEPGRWLEALGLVRDVTVPGTALLAIALSPVRVVGEVREPLETLGREAARAMLELAAGGSKPQVVELQAEVRPMAE